MPKIYRTKEPFTMAVDALQTVDMIELLENFVGKLRPDNEMVRKKLDYGYDIENQTVFLFELRPDWLNHEIIGQYPFAKATYVQKTGIWKIYWMRANLKWHPYDPMPKVKSLNKFLEIVEEDDHHCFFG